MYSYRNSLKSDTSDEIINTYLLRPIAGIIVWVLYYTPITPNQVTIVSIIYPVLGAPVGTGVTSTGGMAMQTPAE